MNILANIIFKAFMPWKGDPEILSGSPDNISVLGGSLECLA